MICKAYKTDGTPCNANATSNNEYCFSHNPEYAQEKLEAVQKGGYASRKYLLDNDEEVVLNDAADAKVFLGRVINGVWRGEIPATPVGTALGFLIRCFLDAHDKADIENS